MSGLIMAAGLFGGLAAYVWEKDPVVAVILALMSVIAGVGGVASARYDFDD